MNLSPDNVDSELEQHHKDAMLELILAWGSLGGATKLLLSDLKGCTLKEGADRFATVPLWRVFNEISDVLQNEYGHMQVGRNIAKNWLIIKKRYEHHSKSRNIIAHSHCAGFLKDRPNYVILLPFKKHSDDLMACDCVPIRQMRDATHWGRKPNESICCLSVHSVEVEVACQLVAVFGGCIVRDTRPSKRGLHRIVTRAG